MVITTLIYNVTPKATLNVVKNGIVSKLAVVIDSNRHVITFLTVLSLNMIFIIWALVI